MAEPKIGDIGLIEPESSTEFGDPSGDLDDEMKRNIRREEANLNVRDSQLEQYIEKASIRLTEEEMRQAESNYVQIDERAKNDDDDDGVEEDNSASGKDAANTCEAPDKKGAQEESKGGKSGITDLDKEEAKGEEETPASSLDQPTLLA